MLVYLFSVSRSARNAAKLVLLPVGLETADLSGGSLLSRFQGETVQLLPHSGLALFLATAPWLTWSSCL